MERRRDTSQGKGIHRSQQAAGEHGTERSAFQGAAPAGPDSGLSDSASLLRQGETMPGVLPARSGQIFPEVQDASGELPAHENAGRPGLLDPLSEREREVLQGISAGFSNKEIARKLILSRHTVKIHAGNIFSKLGVETRQQAAALVRKDSQTVLGQEQERPAGPQPGTPLTPREREVEQYVLDGYSDAEIAAALNISCDTATQHVRSILDKYGAVSRVGIMPPVPDEYFQKPTPVSQEESVDSVPFSRLSDDERRVLQHLSAGARNKEIARALDIPLSTVKTHVRHILGKMGVETRQQAAARIRQENQAANVPDTESAALKPGTEPLTPRESEIKGYILEGRSDAEIAAILSVSLHTVKKHVRSILQKHNVDSRIGVMRPIDTDFFDESQDR